MIETLLARWLSAQAARLAAKLLPVALIAIAIATLALWLHGIHRHAEKQDAVIATQIGQIAKLERDLAAEEASRAREIAGLTSLAEGLAAAGAARAADHRILEETIDANHPTPTSPGLAALLGRLRAADAATGVQQPAAGARRAAAGGPGRTR